MFALGTLDEAEDGRQVAIMHDSHPSAALDCLLIADDLTGACDAAVTAGTAVRHFKVMHHMMAKAATIWSKETGTDRNPADQVEIRRAQRSARPVSLG